ncbi:hypothetical protein G210_4230 [Candida maltosa Xu316]|uniref:Altered inheritance of mitochondria protein 23, mitochondrial n=1 Tax=Candida maltosa (strain Xu316) TaxID=1245528 RepID=M3JE11_CANMX|nr:hypothetical protein G210_4230 [Candida maltosa Xu316]
MNKYFLRSFSSCLRTLESTNKPLNRFKNLYNNTNNTNNNKNSNRPKRPQTSSTPRPYKQHQQQQPIRTYPVDARNFRFKNGTPSTQSAAQSVVTQIYAQEGTKNFQVYYVNETNKLIKKPLIDVLNEINFDTNGIQFTYDQEKKRSIVRKVKVEVMVRKHKDMLAAEAQRKLLESDNHKAQYVLNRKLKSEQKKSATREIVMKWGITMNDFRNQKKNEIEKFSAKGKAFVIGLIHDKGRDEGLHVNLVCKKDPEMLGIEIQRRELLFNELSGLLTELKCEYETEGNKETKLRFLVTPPPPVKPQPQVQELKPVKETKRKQIEPKETKKYSEDELDASYSFKIED